METEYHWLTQHLVVRGLSNHVIYKRITAGEWIALHRCDLDEMKSIIINLPDYYEADELPKHNSDTNKQNKAWTKPSQ